MDHGKTTLVDQLLRAGSGGAELDGERVMDSIELERERGITIMSKVTRVQYEGLGFNIVETYTLAFARKTILHEESEAINQLLSGANQPWNEAIIQTK